MPNLLCATTLMMVFATPVWAQIPAEPGRAALMPLEAAAGKAPDIAGVASADVLSGFGHPSGVSAPSVSTRRDSLWNGAIVGAGTGAMLGLAFGVSREDACRACAGFNQPLAYGALFAAVGAGVGAGVDAMFRRAAPITSGVPRVRVLPLLSRDVKGIVGGVRF
jgi:hypothetical protein